ncbi:MULTISPECIES: DNRLRE domain-containing protein [unclassified Streptomyces]|uniref:CBM96 family carbohydrate-binding protein n=1 Tax=unclassified Streptomyces TaxID=2593676 RepID=UPI001BECF684|nr:MULTISPECIES: DNRLRE domain-containing protein [unclassified Streptomyces]MBT2403948.1 DNRLRE domain-containing protein [Streptomyces sp. ISL-21]MBT2457459.1 DNRLRE domain-containing protein [Streptomyces sp. ISL-86]MBT2608397.1 DNRLRE domain-containing protein [Streptomyces sp. ISL-87]
MRRTRGLTAALVLSLAGAGTGLGLVLMPEASAITQPVAFTADALPTWQPNGIVWAMAQTNGTVFAGGTFSAVRPPAGASGTEQEAVNFVALDAATGNPTSCKLAFTIGEGTATVRTLVVSKDGKTLYAGGYFGAVNGTPVSSIAAIDVESCTPKASFHPGFPATVRALAVSDDTLYAAGDFTTVEGQSRERFAAVDATSGAVKPFSANADEPGRAVAVTPDGKNVLLGGDFFSVNGTSTHALAVVNSTTGAITKTYSNIPSNSVVKNIATDETGFYTGNEGSGGGVFDGRIGLKLSDFTEKWRDRCLGATQYVLPYDGVLYSSSHAHDCTLNGEYPDGKRHHLLAQPTNYSGTAPAPVDGFVASPRKLGWFPDTNDGLGEGIGPRVMAVVSSGDTKYMWVGGEFTTVNGSEQQSLTRFASTGDVGAPTTPVASAASVKPGEAQVRWRTSYDADDSKLTYRIYRNGSATPIHTMTAESLEFERPQASWADTTVKAGQSYTYRVTATDAAGNTSARSASAAVTVPTSVQSYPNQVRADGAQLYWRYDDTVSPYIADSSNGGNTSGIQMNTPSLRQTPGAVTGTSTAIGFNGTSQQVYSDHRQSVGASYTIETWFKTNTTRGGKLIGFGNNQNRNSGSYDKQIYMTNTGRLIFGVYNGSARTIATGLLDTYNDSKWHHVVGTQGPGGMALYVDGQSKGTLNVTNSTPYAGYWHVGGDNLASWPTRPTSNFFGGQVDETAVYPTALTAAQIKNHFDLAKAPTDSVFKVNATEDTYINQGAPSTAYGTSTSLAVRGTSAYETYLRFNLPAAPAGQVLKAASLQFKTTTQAGAGTPDKVSVVPVTGTWSGAGTTFNTKPTLGTTPLGSITGVPDGSAVNNVELDTAAVSAVLGTSYSLGLTSTGTDAMWIWSAESTAADGIPQLVLTFGAK